VLQPLMLLLQHSNLRRNGGKNERLQGVILLRRDGSWALAALL
jgi:hypothetical protein